MGGHVAVPCPPLDSGVREDKAVIARGKFLDFLTTDALFDDRMATPTVKLTPVSVHEKAFDALLYRSANHGYHILS
jgi:hypothetical protein